MQRGIVTHGAVAALVQAQAGGIQKHFTDVLHQREADLINGTGFRQPAQTVFGTQTIHSCLFHNGLAVGDGVQLAVQTVALDGELTILGDHILQRQRFDALVQLFKGLGLKATQQNHDTFAHPQTQIGFGHGIVSAGKKCPAVFHPDVFHLHALELIAHQSFQTEQAGNGKSKILTHGISISSKIQFFRKFSCHYMRFCRK